MMQVLEPENRRFQPKYEQELLWVPQYTPTEFNNLPSLEQLESWATLITAREASEG